MTSRLFDLTGRTAVVVGGTTGIGRALALGLADAGADVVVTGRRRDVVDARGGRNRGARPTDAASSGRRRRRSRRCAPCATRAWRRFSKSTSSSPRPASTKRVPTLEMTEGDWGQILDTNLTGMFRTYQVFAPPMIARGSGRLIGIASLASFVGLLEVAAYTASKAGVAGLTRALAVEWARARRHGERDRARRVRDRLEPRAPERSARTGIPDADADEALRAGRGAGGRRGLSRVGRRDLRHRTAAGRRRRIPGKRSESVNAVLSSASATTWRPRSSRSTRARELRAGAWTVVAAEAIPRGHKVAVRAIRAGEAVVKYGSPIGTASADIAAGRARAHAQRASERGRGDLRAIRRRRGESR